MPVSRELLRNSSEYLIRPLQKSTRIPFVLMRFCSISALSAIVDNALFLILHASTGNLALSQVGARAVSVLFNYSAVRKAAFRSARPHRAALPRYLALVIANVFLSYAGIRLLTSGFSIRVFPAKLLAETILFVGNFAIQRGFVFAHRGSKVATLAR